MGGVSEEVACLFVSFTAVMLNEIKAHNTTCFYLMKWFCCCFCVCCFLPHVLTDSCIFLSISQSDCASSAVSTDVL